jgi:serine O-acetyltransferase
MAVYERDPACHRFIQPILFFKGYQAVQAYRIGHWLWRRGGRDMAYFVQMRVSEVFGVDIHPAARDRQGHHDRPCPFHRHRRNGGGRRQCVDAAFGDAGRHRQGRWRPPPQDRRWRDDRGRGQGAGQYPRRHCSRIAAGSVVLEPVPPNTTVAGVPARVVGKAGCDQPALTMDQILQAE